MLLLDNSFIILKYNGSSNHAQIGIKQKDRPKTFTKFSDHNLDWLWSNQWTKLTFKWTIKGTNKFPEAKFHVNIPDTFVVAVHCNAYCTVEAWYFVGLCSKVLHSVVVAAAVVVVSTHHQEHQTSEDWLASEMVDIEPW